MDWQHAGVGEIDGQLERLTDDLHIQVAMEHDAVAGREAALATIDGFNAIICRCRDAEEADKDEINELLQERHRIVRQREASQ